MSKSRSASRSVSSGTISIGVNHAQELVDFLTQRYEQVKGELDHIKETSVPPSSSSRQSSYGEDGGERESGPSSTTENEEESELDTLRACNEDLKNQLAASEQQRLALLQQIQPFLAQNAALASEADAARQQKINSIYPPVAFLPPGANPSTVRFSSPQVLSGKLPADTLEGRPIRFLPRPPACLPIRVAVCGRHGYWFSPVITHPEDVEFELVVEGKPSEWTYLGRYKSVHLPDGEMQLSEWLALDDETKRVHCAKAAAQKLGQTATPAMVSTTATELRQQYESGQAAVPCFTLVCTGFILQVYTALQGAATRTRKRDSVGQAGVKRIKREAK